MGLIEDLFPTPEKQQGHQIVIPEHRIKKLQRELKQKEQERKGGRPEKTKVRRIILPGKKPLFEVHEIFGVGGISMIKGTVLRGRIKPRAKVVLKKKKFSVNEVMKNNQKVAALFEGEYGTLFFNRLSSLPWKQGNIIEFE